MKNTSLEKLEFNIKQIKDSKMRYIYGDFVRIRLEEKKNVKLIYDHRQSYRIFAEALKDISFNKFTWNSMCEAVSKNRKNAKVITLFLTYLIKKDIYEGEYRDYINDFIEHISKENVTINLLLKLFKINKNPIHFYLIKFNNYKKSDLLVDLNTSNIFLRKIMIEFIDSSPNTSRSYNKFFQYFESSLWKYQINKIKDFNIDTFNFQFKYYAKMKEKRFLNALSLFYLFLCSNYSSENIFADVDEVDLNILKRADFVKSYKLGFRKILYNPNDPVPICNRWYLAPNGFEITSTRINANDYIKIDFDIILDEEMKKYAKMWVWTNTEVSIKTNVAAIVNAVKIFANFIYKFRKKTNIKIISLNKGFMDKNTISQFEVYCFKNYIQTIHTNEATIAYILTKTRSFVKFLEFNNIVKVEHGILYILRNGKVNAQYKEKNIPIDNLKSFEKQLKEKAKESYINALYYALFHLSISCELRISQLINLTIDSVQESMKKGEYVIKSITKTSNGEKIEQPISARTKNHIDNILKITENIRNECPDPYLSKFIFLNKVRTNLYGVMKAESFRKHLKKCCELAELPNYTHKNLRATYITKAKEVSDENNWSKFDFLKITNHKNFGVVDKHYIGNQVRNLLEATYGIIIGDTPVKGQITINSTVKQTPENTVDDGCGMCTIKSCTIRTELGCPMCSNFISMISSIPYFEKRIIKIDNKILNANIVHEVDILRAMKKIYVAYLEKLYILKEGLDIE